MEIVINISDSVYNTAKRYSKDKHCIKVYEVDDILNAIAKGTPLPKGHGRIADIDRVMEEMDATRTYDIPFALERVKPIIEADRKGQE